MTGGPIIAFVFRNILWYHPLSSEKSVQVGTVLSLFLVSSASLAIPRSERRLCMVLLTSSLS